MTAPTEAEIRARLIAVFDQYGDELYDELGNVVEAVAEPLNCAAKSALGKISDVPTMETSLWGVLSPEPARVLDSIVSAAIERAVGRCVDIILEELTAAGVQFAQEHPDAPRAVREPVPG